MARKTVFVGDFSSKERLDQDLDRRSAYTALTVQTRTRSPLTNKRLTSPVSTTNVPRSMNTTRRVHLHRPRGGHDVDDDKSDRAPSGR